MKKRTLKPHQRNRKRTRLRLERLEHRIPLAADMAFGFLHYAQAYEGFWIESEIESFDSAFSDQGYAGLAAQENFAFADIAFHDEQLLNELSFIGDETFYEADSLDFYDFAEWNVVEPAFDHSDIFAHSVIEAEYDALGFDDSSFGGGNAPGLGSEGLFLEEAELITTEIALPEVFIAGDLVPITPIETEVSLPFSVGATTAESDGIVAQEVLQTSILVESPTSSVSIAFESEGVETTDSIALYSTTGESQSLAADAEVSTPERVMFEAIAAPSSAAVDAFGIGMVQVDHGPLRVPDYAASSTGYQNAATMTEGMRTLGLNILLQRQSNGVGRSALPWHSPSVSARDAGAHLQAFSQASEQWSQLAEKTRLELSISETGYTNFDAATELYVGSPVGRLHGFEAFDIFDALVVDSAPKDAALSLSSQHAYGFALDSTNWMTATAIGVTVFGTSFYAYNHKLLSRSGLRKMKSALREKKHAGLIWGHAAGWAVDEVLDETRPIIVKLSM
ncbi:MAG: hypothetical protein AAFV88_20390 [Planctomycetota bacterium]